MHQEATCATMLTELKGENPKAFAFSLTSIITRSAILPNDW